LLAYEARIRHAANCRREEGTARRLASVRSRVIADLRCAIASDIEGFLRADGDQSGSGLTCCNGSSAQGFVVSRTDAHVATRMLAVDLKAGTLSCRYETRGSSIGEPSNQRVLAIEIGNDGAALSLWDGGLDRTFATVDVLSAFLLAPILSDA
jgi:hypothetical protein